MRHLITVVTITISDTSAGESKSRMEGKKEKTGFVVVLGNRMKLWLSVCWGPTAYIELPQNRAIWLHFFELDNQKTLYRCESKATFRDETCHTYWDILIFRYCSPQLKSPTRK